MGTYIFERGDQARAASDADGSLRSDVITALEEIDWVESFSFHADVEDDGIVAVDVVFDEQWPDVRTSNPDQVSEVFNRLGLRTIANPGTAGSQVSADDPLSAEPIAGDDDGFELFLLDDDEPARAANG